ncbi:uncharacterized protein LOC120110790 [Phoenix dactylifera]|uniref:Uncharacterized protein LOC120110790 n=1 Tax=Phoenix dactylifera TaxID=42345 RepID=A0A8B9AEE7_PHODC|nr:uncharacterized protein LOC120110790 [Phoenix dactylifera]
MQRQSLGAPGAKLQVNGNSDGGEREERRKSSAGVGAAAAAAAAAAAVAGEEEDIKVEKLIRSSSRMERSIHLIPVLTVLCLLLLYLISHDPSPNELEKLGGDAHLLFQNAGSATEIGRNIGVGIGGGGGRNGDSEPSGTEGGEKTPAPEAILGTAPRWPRTCDGGRPGAPHVNIPGFASAGTGRRRMDGGLIYRRYEIFAFFF